jgi:hypothetical protein
MKSMGPSFEEGRFACLYGRTILATRVALGTSLTVAADLMIGRIALATVLTPKADLGLLHKAGEDREGQGW